MARSTRTEADQSSEPVEAQGVSSVPEVPADAPVAIDVSGLDFEAHAATLTGGYTVSTAPSED